MEHVATIASLLVVSILSGVAVFYPDYDDTLLERLGLSFISIGSLGIARYIYNMDIVPGAVMLCSIGAAAYSLEVGRKIHREKTSCAPADPDRRTCRASHHH